MNKKYVIFGSVGVAVLVIVFFLIKDNFRSAYYQIGGNDASVTSTKYTVKYAKTCIAADKTWVKSTDPDGYYKNYYINSETGAKFMW